MTVPQHGKQDGDGASELWRLSGMGMEFVSAIAAGGVIGWLIDRWLGTQPRGVLIGLVVGILGGGFNLIKQAMAANRKAMEAFRARSHGTPPDENQTDWSGKEGGKGRKHD